MYNLTGCDVTNVVGERGRGGLGLRSRLTASSGSSSSVLTMNGHQPFMCFILNIDTVGTEPSSFIRSIVHVFEALAPRGMRVRSMVRSPVTS